MMMIGRHKNVVHLFEVHEYSQDSKSPPSQRRRLSMYRQQYNRLSQLSSGRRRLYSVRLYIVNRLMRNAKVKVIKSSTRPSTRRSHLTSLYALFVLYTRSIHYCHDITVCVCVCVCYVCNTAEYCATTDERSHNNQHGRTGDNQFNVISTYNY